MDRKARFYTSKTDQVFKMIRWMEIQDDRIVGNGGQASLIGQWGVGKPRGFRPEIDKGLTPCIGRLHVKYGVCRESYTRTSMRKDFKSVFRD